MIGFLSMNICTGNDIDFADGLNDGKDGISTRTSPHGQWDLDNLSRDAKLTKLFLDMSKCYLPAPVFRLIHPIIASVFLLGVLSP
jgi:hypothetical protein